MKLKPTTIALIVIAFLVPVFVIAGTSNPLDAGTVNALSTTAENCFSYQQNRTAWCISNLEASGGIDVRYKLYPNSDTTGVVTTANGIELKGGMTDCYPIGGEPVFSGRVSCIAESGTPSVNTWSY